MYRIRIVQNSEHAGLQGLMQWLGKPSTRCGADPDAFYPRAYDLYEPGERWPQLFL